MSDGLHGWLRSLDEPKPADDGDLEDPELIFLMLDVLRDERIRRDDPRWNPGERRLEQLAQERHRALRERGRRGA